MSISVNTNPKLASELNALIEGKSYRTRDEAIEDAIRFLIAVKGKLYTRSEVKEVLSEYISVSSDTLLEEIKEEEEL
ncbi:Metal-responsive transcriptional regulator [Candidatus Methanophagaceae archaeon]|nr:Metal-responsive transcriptional regulator [Methanophagales archaeon]